jgi:hypothetical protein
MSLFPMRAACVVLACGSALAFAQSLPEGWTSREVDGGILYSPARLPPGMQFSLFAVTVGVGNATTSAAFELAKARAMPPEALQCRAPQQDSGAVTQRCSGSNGTLDVTFVQLPVRGGQAHLMRMALQGDEAALKPHKDGFSAVMQAQTQAWKASAGGKPAPPEPSKKDLEAKARTEARNAIAEAVRTAPGKGLRSDQVEGVLNDWRQVYEISGLQYDETLYLLLKDGTAYSDAWVPPEDFDVAASRKLQPGRWLQWRRQNGAYELRGSEKDSWRRLSQATLGTPARRDERLSKAYVHSSFANRGGLGGSANQWTIFFRPDGRYEESSYGIQGTGAVQAGNGYTGGSSRGSGKDGSWSSGSGSQTGPGGTVSSGSTQTRNDGSAYAGNYRLDGWTIEFQVDNGKTTRKLFFHSASGINVGATWYSEKK